ncbi:MAG: chemotaxis protein CheB [Pikeienuella sp.]|uniref:chemotaxis protein CheB n=1 Tax=Pikeienuella sp. TaxID=2831957 RepID=UPI00391918B8
MEAETVDTAATQPYVVGIGASAGGLEALRDLFRNLPRDSGAVYVVVQHMSPTHKSLLSTLIARETRLDVLDVEDGMKPAPGAIYVAPPSVDVIYRAGRLRLVAGPQGSVSPKPSVDRFFLSLAESARERAAGIVLSGTGSDGAFGVRAIRGAGGLTIAQDSESAKYDGMPSAAVETGCVDLVLSPVEIGAQLGRIIASPHDLDRFRPPAGAENPLAELLQIVLARTRVDFRDYKPTTIQRRLERRMIALGLDDQAEYVRTCRSNPAEVDALFRDFLVSVTWFFRDPLEFLALAPLVREIAARRTGRPARVWIAGCATGEEAYSVAILFAEAMGGPEAIGKDKLQIFASDIDARALDVARRGRYPRAAIENVPQEYVSRYFTLDDDGVTVHPALKDTVIFSYHNVCQDPPFINLDLICCRNLLIYFNQPLQARVFSRFAYALEAEGSIFLGTAETVSVSEDLFVRIGDGAHLYRRRHAARRPMIRFGGYDLPVGTDRASRAAAAREAASEASAAEDRSMFDALARTLGPDVALVSDDFRILRVYGDLGRYVTLNENTRLQMSLSMLAPELAQEARTLVTVALRSGQRRQGVAHRSEGAPGEALRIEVFPLARPGEDERLALVAFSRQAEAQPARPAEADPGGEWLETVERELASTREALQQTIEALETSNEELQSANEELQSTNEELQATNEELETSNEELQSSNEELVTVNEELQISSAELATTNEELSTILQNVAAPLLIIDSALQITKASREAIQLFRLEPPLDTPHLSQCALPEGFPPLVDIANEALQLGRATTREFASDGAFHTLRCAPVATQRGQLQGVTMTFMASPGAGRLAAELAHIFERAPVLLMRRDAEGRVLRISERAAALLGVSPDAAEGALLTDLAGAESGERILAGDRAFLASGRSAEAAIEGGAGGWRQIVRYRFQPTAEEAPTVYAIGFDITDRRERELELLRLSGQTSLAEAATGAVFWSADPATGRMDWPDAAAALHGGAPERLEDLADLYDEAGAEAARRAMRNALAAGGGFGYAAKTKASGRTVRCAGRALNGADGAPLMLIGLFRPEGELAPRPGAETARRIPQDSR